MTILASHPQRFRWNPGRTARLCLLVLCALLLTAVQAAAERGPAEVTPAAARTPEAPLIAGRVIDAETGAPLARANIYVQGGEAGTISAAGGYFSLPGVPSEEFVLVVTYVGYEASLVPVDLASWSEGEELEIALEPVVYTSEEVVVTASRYGSDVHLSHSNLPQDEIRRRQSEMDIPLLLEDTPSLYAATDAGNGTGYTYLKIRGFDQRRVGVLVNGIPLNDPEDHQVYWVDLPDLASSLEDVQIQRGVTNSVGGLATIGGTVNLITDLLPVEPQGRLLFQAGSYGTAKQTLSYNTGLLDGRLATGLRLSHLQSDGYRDRASTDQWAVFWSGRYLTPNSSTRVNIYTGHELTQHAWDAVDEATLARDRTFNPETYHNAIDDFRQPHYELHHTWDLSPAVKLRNSVYLIHGEGFYENFKDDRTAADFSLDHHLGLDPDAEVDLVRRKWVRKDQVGWLPSLEITHGGGRLVVGGDAYTFHSNHWGDVLSVQGFTPGQMPDGLKYHDYTGDKDAWSVYVNERYEVIDGVTLLADVQFQHRQYDFRQNAVGNFRGELLNAYSVDYDFFNPRGGFHWDLPGTVGGAELGLYAYVGVNHREPADSELFDTWDGPDDLGVSPLFRQRREVLAADGTTVDHVEWSDPIVTEERVIDYELGTSLRSGSFAVTVNGYWMEFTDEIVPYGTVDDEGAGIRGNAERTLHRGIELSLSAQPTDGHLLTVAASRSFDEFDQFTFFDWDGTPSDLSGNPIALFPEYLATLKWRADWGRVDSSVRWRLVGKQHLDNSGQDERTIAAYSVLDVGLGVNLGELGLGSLAGARLDGRVRNLLDEEYETNGYYDSWAGANFKIPAAKRNFMVGVEYPF